MPGTNTIKRSYPWQTTINGKTFTFKLLERKDREASLAFARSIPYDDLIFLTFDITDSKDMDGFIKSVEDHKALSVIIESDGKHVGFGSLNYNQVAWTSHLGEIRLLVNPAYRGYGLGKLIINEVFVLAQELGLRKLVAQMASEQRGAIKAFEHLGFKAEALLADYVIDKQGRTHDLVIMSHDISGFNE